MVGQPFIHLTDHSKHFDYTAGFYRNPTPPSCIGNLDGDQFPGSAPRGTSSSPRGVCGSCSEGEVPSPRDPSRACRWPWRSLLTRKPQIAGLSRGWLQWCRCRAAGNASNTLSNCPSLISPPWAEYHQPLLLLLPDQS